jgi:hypothetical protein
MCIVSLNVQSSARARSANPYVASRKNSRIVIVPPETFTNNPLLTAPVPLQDPCFEFLKQFSTPLVKPAADTFDPIKAEL